jgi:hypothetical protein
VNRRDKIGLLVTAALLAAGCSYRFDNAAEALGAGEVRGRAVTQRRGAPGAVDSAVDVSVGLVRSGAAQASRPTGSFALLGLPQGTHTVIFRKGVDLAARREVTIGLGSDGQTQGVLLGDVVLYSTAAVAGQAVLPGPPGSIWVTEGRVVDLTTGFTAPMDAGGTFTFPAMEVGDHALALWAVDGSSPPVQYVAGPIPLTVTEADQQTTKSLSSVPLTQASGTGQLQLRLRLLGAPAGVGVQDLQVSVSGITPAPTVAADGTVYLTAVPEGFRRITITVPNGTDMVGPPDLSAVVFHDQLTDLGSVYVVSAAFADQSQRACAVQADCPTGPCQAGSCSGWTSLPTVISPALAVCDRALDCSLVPPGSACSSPPVTSCTSVDATAALHLCVPCQYTCNLDGQATLQGPACPP